MRACVYSIRHVPFVQAFVFSHNTRKDKHRGHSMNKEILTTKEAASYLGMSMAFLERDRWAGARIPFMKIGSRSVRYSLDDLNTYLESQVRKSTSDIGGAA